MASIWKTKVLPKLKKIFSSDKKKAAIQAKLFDKEKETIDKEVDEKKDELTPKLLELFEAADPETKALLQSPTEAAVKAKTEAVAKLLKDLADKGYPGASLLNDAVAKVGVASLAGPITWLLKKVSTFLPPAPTPPVEADTKAVEVKKEAEVEEKKEGEAAAPPPPSTEKPEDVALAASIQQVVLTTTEAPPEVPKAPEPVVPAEVPAPAPPVEAPPAEPAPAAPAPAT